MNSIITDPASQVTEASCENHDFSPRVAVVIPYYQREPGILSRTVDSVFAQEGFDSYIVLVVDDDSPVPAREELASRLVAEPVRLRLLEQPNAGPGAARNCGLDNVPDSCEYVAFLDSDDQWFPSHLQNACNALDLGYDFYFSDHYFSDYKEKSAFVRAGKIPLEKHHQLDPTRCLYEYIGDMLDQILIYGNVIGTSTVTYRFRKFCNLRFREAYFNGQDYLFWLDISKLTRQIVFSSKVECDYGIGINIYVGSGWSTDKSIRRLRNEILLWTDVGKEFCTTSYRKTANAKRLQRLRESVVRDIFHRISHHQNINGKVLWEICQINPTFSFHAIPIGLRIVFEKLLSSKFMASH